MVPLREGKVPVSRMLQQEEGHGLGAVSHAFGTHFAGKVDTGYADEQAYAATAEHERTERWTVKKTVWVLLLGSTMRSDQGTMRLLWWRRRRWLMAVMPARSLRGCAKRGARFCYPPHCSRLEKPPSPAGQPALKEAPGKSCLPRTAH